MKLAKLKTIFADKEKKGAASYAMAAGFGASACGRRLKKRLYFAIDPANSNNIAGVGQYPEPFDKRASDRILTNIVSLK